jgi:hypothetical protein
LTEVVVDVGLLMTSVTAANAGTAAVTKAVVAICWVFVPGLAVVESGTPVRLGEAIVA